MMRTDTGRVEWIDVAKALSILMVTMMHTGQLAQPSGVDVGRLVELNHFLSPIRMPLFFAAAGVFAGSALAKPWGDLLRRKVALYVWLFMIWTVVRWVFCATLLPNPDNPAEGSSISEIGWAILMPTTGLWFLWCLAIFFVVAKALQRFDKRLTLLAVVIVSVISLMITESQNADTGFLSNLAHRNALRYFVFFYGAAMSPQIVIGIGSWRLVSGILALSIAFILCYALYCLIDGPLAAPARFGASIAGVGLLLLLARILDRFALPSRLLRYLGRNTLPIYVAQVPLIAIYVAGFKAMGLAEIVLLKNFVAPMGVVFTVLASLGVRRILNAAGAGAMYRLPRTARTVTLRPTAAA